MRWQLDEYGKYEDLLTDDGAQCGWVLVKASKGRADALRKAIGIGDYYGFAGTTYVRGETIEEAKALAVVAYKMRG